MSLEPFLANIPMVLRENMETQDFITTLIRWLEQARREINTNAGQSTESSNDFFDLGSSANNTASNDSFDSSSNDLIGTVDVNGQTVEILDRQIANVQNSGVAILDGTPPRNYRVEIRNADGSNVTINGNGRLINGQISVSIPTRYTVRVIQYFIETDDFGII